MPRWQRFAIEAVVSSLIYAAYKELFAGLSLDVSFEQASTWI